MVRKDSVKYYETKIEKLIENNRGTKTLRTSEKQQIISERRTRTGIKRSKWPLRLLKHVIRIYMN